MKRIAFLFLLLFAIDARAGSGMPECWTTNGEAIGFNPAGEEIADGQWLFLVDLKKVSTEEFRWIMGQASSGPFRQGSEPLYFSGRTVLLHAVANNQGGRVPRLRLQELARARLAILGGHRGLRSIECNGIAHPTL